MHDQRLVSGSRLQTTLITAVALLLLAACNIPQFGQGEEAEEIPFEVTPYAPAESTTESPAASSETARPSETDSSESESAETSTESFSSESSSSATSSSSTTMSASTSDASSSVSLRQPYNGEIVAKDKTTIVAETNVMALEDNMEVGDEIVAGDELVQVDRSVLEAQRAQSLAGLEAAQSQLDLILLDPEEEDLEAARAGVSAAAAAYQRAREGATDEDERMALAQLRQAEAAVTVAQAGYNQVKGNPMIAALPQSLQLQQATLQKEAAQAQYEKVLKGSTSDIIAGAYAQLAQARASLARLEEGAKPAQVQAIEAQVKQAETALYLAQLQLDKATISAPVDGTVSEVFVTVGSMVAPGAPVTTLLSPIMEVVIQVEEYRLDEIEIGQGATLGVDAHPGQIFEGEIVRIAPELDPASRTVAVTIRPDDSADQLAPGMFATVELAAK
jgi:HlyD family secretion protein